MAGEYYRAKKRTGGFSEALAPLFQFFTEENQKQEQAEYLKGLLNAYESNKQKIDKISQTNLKESTADRTPVNMLGATGPDNKTPLYDFNDEMETEILGDFIPRKQRIEEGSKIADDFFIRQIMKPNMDAERINILGSVLDKNVDRMKPGKKTYMTGSEKDTYAVDEFGEKELFIPGKEEKEDVVLGVGNYGGVKGLEYGYMDGDKKTVKKFDPFSLSSSKTRTEEEGKFPDVTKQLGTVETTIEDIENLKKSKYDPKTKKYSVIGQDEEGNPVTKEMSQEEINKIRDDKKTKAIGDVTEVIGKRELDGAIGTIRENVEKRSKKKIENIDYKEVEKEVNAFIRANPDYATDKPYLIAYFRLFKL